MDVSLTGDVASQWAAQNWEFSQDRGNDTKASTGPAKVI
jgi:hypothetical protein